MHTISIIHKNNLILVKIYGEFCPDIERSNFEHLTEDFEVFDFRDKVNVATYSIFSASKYIYDMLNTCVNFFVPI